MIIIKTDIGLVAQLMPNDAKTFLDVGGNDGELFHELGVRCTIIDNDRNSLNSASKRGHKTVLFDLNSRKKFLFGDNSFDLVLCNNVLEHVIYPGYVISEIYRVTKKYAIFIVPNDAYKLSGRLKVLFGRPHFYDENSTTTPHIQFYDYKTLTKLIKSYGFSIKKEIVQGKPSMISKNLSGSWSFLCTKHETSRTETIRNMSLKSWCFK